MNNEKKYTYETPSISLISFDAEDILTTSGFEGENDDLSL
jgi:hypothetical protein